MDVKFKNVLRACRHRPGLKCKLCKDKIGLQDAYGCKTGCREAVCVKCMAPKVNLKM